ncbi:LamG domain-containing protein [Nocardioides pacificus]
MPTHPACSPHDSARRRLLLALTALALVVTSLSLVTWAPAPAAQAASPALAVSPANHVGGQRLTWTGNVGARGVRSLVLQFHMLRPGDRWTTVKGFSAKTRADGGFSFAYPAPGMFNIRYRVKAGRHVSPSRLFNAKSEDLTLRVTGQEDNNAGQPASVSENRSFGITVDTAPDNIFRNPSSRNLPVFPGRPVTLQRRIDGASWATVATAAVGDGGLAQFTGLTEKAGVSVYRARLEDYRRDGHNIGWTHSFPLFVYTGSAAWNGYQQERRRAENAVSTAPPRIPDSGVGRATPTASSRHRWGKMLWDFAWEHGQSLTDGPSRGTRPRGRWVDYVDGAGRVSRYNGQLTLDSKRYAGAGIGDFGTTHATLSGNAAKQGRWEARMRVRGAYEAGGRSYGILAELVPARASDYDCGTHNITIASVSPFSRRVTFGARSPQRSWSGAATASATPLRSAYAVAVEVSKRHITWFLDGKPIGSVKSRAAYAGVPMTIRLSLVGQGSEEMNHVSLVSDWVRGFPISSGKHTVARKKLTGRPASGC